jgi:hypothetical protein
MTTNIIKIDAAINPICHVSRGHLPQSLGQTEQSSPTSDSQTLFPHSEEENHMIKSCFPLLWSTKRLCMHMKRKIYSVFTYVPWCIEDNKKSFTSRLPNSHTLAKLSTILAVFGFCRSLMVIYHRFQRFLIVISWHQDRIWYTIRCKN